MNIERKKGTNIVPEITAAIYMHLFILLKPLLIKYSYKSTFILFAVTVGLLAVDLIFGNYVIRIKLIKKVSVLICGVTLVFIADFLTRKNEYTWEYFYYFLIYGVVFAAFLINVNNIKKLLYFWLIFAFSDGVIIFLDPFLNYRITGDYMGFGSAIVFPYAASCILFFFFRKKLFALPMSLFLIETIIFANRGATFVAISLLIFSIIFTTKDKKKRIIRIILIILFSIIILCCLKSILNIFYNISKTIGLGSYSLRGFNEMLENLGKSDSGRFDIWKNAVNEIKFNFVFGLGIGGFSAKYNNYPHNLFLDILVTHGLIFGGSLIVFLFIQIKKIFNSENKYYFILSLTLCLTAFVQLMTSYTYWTNATFWQFIILGLVFGNAYLEKGDSANESFV